MYPTKIEQYTRLTITHVYEDGSREVIACQLPVAVTVKLEERQGVILPTIELNIGPHWDPDVDLDIEEDPGNRIVTYPAPELTRRERAKSVPRRRVFRERDDW